MHGTTPMDAATVGVPIQTLAVEVVEGPDQGLEAVAATESLTIGTADGNDLVLSDPTVSRYHVELLRTGAGIRVTDHASTNGTVMGGVRIERGIVRIGSVLRIGRTKIEVREAGPQTVEVHDAEALAGVLGRSQSMRRLMATVKKAAATDVPALLVGESGSGKEVIARAIHELSGRRDGPYVIVDCGALSPELVASELFGHEKGAFTGADRQHVGAFERAHGGTLFLDEIGELPTDLQPVLLGALERRRFHRVGGRKDVSVDVRILAATNRDLRSEVNANTFRLDLFYRIAVLTLAVPPLRERAEDIPLLVQHFAREMGVATPIDELVSPEALRNLAAHRWPGNVRELRNWVEATLALGEPLEIASGQSVQPASSDPYAIAIARLLELPYKGARAELLTEFEARYLPRLLERTEGNVSEAARVAHMDRSYLFTLLRKHRLR
jgi:DNA-binding NtrC family response regulator